MKYFGDFLVEKNIIGKTDLIESLIDQVTGLPPVSSIVYKNNLLTPDQILKVFAAQNESQVDFKSAAQSLGFWTATIEEKVQEITDEVRIPLGQILVKNGKTDLATLTKSLDEFLSKYSRKPSPPSSSNSSPVDIIFPALDPQLVVEFISSFDSTKLDELGNLLSLIQQNSNSRDLVQEFCQEVHKNLHSFRGMARLAQLTLTERILLAMEKSCIDFLRNIETGPKAEKLASQLTLGVSHLAAVRTFLSQSKSEEDFWKSSERLNAETFLKEMNQ